MIHGVESVCLCVEVGNWHVLSARITGYEALEILSKPRPTHYTSLRKTDGEIPQQDGAHGTENEGLKFLQCRESTKD